MADELNSEREGESAGQAVGGDIAPTPASIRTLKPPLPNTGPIWGRIELESNRAWEAFQYYRDMGIGRSVAAVVKDFGYAGRDTVDKWVNKFRWRDRSAAWDMHLDEEIQKAFEAEAQSMGRRHAQIGMSLQNIGQEKLKEYVEKPSNPPVTVREALDLTKAGVEIERSARAADKGSKGAGAGTIIFNFNMERPPKWAAHVDKSKLIDGGAIVNDESDSTGQSDE